MKRNRVVGSINRVCICIIRPMVHDVPLSLNILLLLILPTVFNAYVINTNEYISFSPKWTFGFLVKYGASFPYILFIPYVLSYFLSCIHYFINNKRIKKSFKILVYSVLLTFFSVNIFLLCNFKTMLSPSIVLLLHETNNGEIYDFFNSYLFDWHSICSYMIIIFIMVVIVIVEKWSYSLNCLFDNRFVRICVFLLTLYMFCRSINPFQKFINMYSCNDLDSLEFWYLDYRPDTNMFTNALYSYYTNIVSKKELLKSRNSTLCLRNDGVTNSNSTIVLVIGESYNKHHSELYGYGRKTNPNLKAEVEKGNLFLFSDVITPFNMTSYVMKNLFSINSIMDKENWGDYPIFPAIIKGAGFPVYFWDNQKTTGKADVSDFSIFSYLYDPDVARCSYTECNTETFLFDLDLIKDYFSRKRNHETRRFVIFHLNGQHDMAENRYPHIPQYMYFSKDSISGNYSVTQKEQIAFYDNATRYNDDVMAFLIDKIRDEEAAIVYLSDHGEEVHDYRDHYGRTQENVKTKGILKYQYEIPFMIWCSDKYKAKYAQKVNSIKDALNKPFMIDNTCHVLFNLGNIKTSHYYAQRDIINPLFKAYNHRVVQKNVVYEDIMSE